jgi:hypothetical protein
VPAPGAEPGRRGEPTVPLAALRDLLRELHSGVAQEAAAARVALALWRRVVQVGDPGRAEAAAREAEARLEALFDALAALEARGRRLVEQAERRGE